MCRGFKFLLQSLFMFFMRESNHWIGDLNRWLSASLLSSHGIQISWLRIWIDQPQFAYWNLDSNLFMRDWIVFVSLNFLECGFESLYEGFESPSSNLLEKLQNWKVNWGILIALLGIRIWTLENSSKCSFVKIFLGIFIYILKHLLSLISKHNMSVLVSSKSTRVQQSLFFMDRVLFLKTRLFPLNC